MIARLIDWSAKNLMLILVGTVFAVAAGLYALQHSALDAIPDLSDTQVIIYTDYKGQAPQVIEDQVNLSADDRHAHRAEIESGARLFLLRRLIRLHYLRGWHRYLLGALACARISEYRRSAVAGRGDAKHRS